MKFSVKDWRTYYDEIHTLGKKLSESMPKYMDTGECIPPVAPLSQNVQKDLENKIKNLRQRSNKYLDQCGMRIPQPLWRYNRKNPETHASSSKFKYAHLIS